MKWCIKLQIMLIVVFIGKKYIVIFFILVVEENVSVAKTCTEQPIYLSTRLNERSNI